MEKVIMVGHLAFVLNLDWCWNFSSWLGYMKFKKDGPRANSGKLKKVKQGFQH